MQPRIPIRQLTAISLLVATAAAVRVAVKIGLSEALTFTSGFAFGPVQGFVTGFLTIVVSDLFTWSGIWTPFIAAIVALIGLVAGIIRRFKMNPSTRFLGVSAIALITTSEVLQNVWFGWYMWSFYLPETSFSTVLAASLVDGLPSMITSVASNTLLFTIVVPRILRILKEWIPLSDKDSPNRGGNT